MKRLGEINNYCKVSFCIGDNHVVGVVVSLSFCMDTYAQPWLRFGVRGHKYTEEKKTCFLCKVNPSHAIAQTPCIFCTQKSLDLYDRMHLN